MNLLHKFHHWRRRQRWNKQYRKGRWESLKSDLESHRYYKIIDFMKQFGPTSPSILDLGCGDGVLRQRMEAFEFEYFKGIDFSSVSIQKANEKQLSKSEFEWADIIKFKPKKNYDIIVFNEVFYYIPETEKIKVMNRMFEHLKKGSIIITSIFREGIGCWEYFKENPQLKELDFTTVTTEKETTYWKIGVYEITKIA
ncbi:MAG: class I SAM-dependent methyltransferase [Flavobacteriaceae bacterium]